ncbi:MAG: hypothetical protein K0R54_3503 [Clostridiaceae bacterium]|jgi:hypothetical protein|nr:hypothetical protein [Clostridiaceae bacterium]
MNNKMIPGYQLIDYFKKLKAKLDTNCINQFSVLIGNNLSIPVKNINIICEGPGFKIELYQEEDSLNPVIFDFVTGQAFRVMEYKNSMHVWILE